MVVIKTLLITLVSFILLSMVRTKRDIVLDRKQHQSLSADHNDTLQSQKTNENSGQTVTLIKGKNRIGLSENRSDSQHILPINTISNVKRVKVRSAENSGVSTRVESLCDKPYIYGAHRLPNNNTVRIYRDEYYWDLIGIPDTQVDVQGPFLIWQKNMGPVDKYCSFQTVASGQLKGVTFKYKGNRFWSWYSDGRQRTGGSTGDKWSQIPTAGFYAAYNDGDLDQKGFSQMIAFSGIFVYYYNTSGLDFKPIGNTSNQFGYEKGKDGEQFPGDLTAAFAFPNTKNPKNYLVYLFQRDKHCARTYLGVNGCPEWRKNRELFGCPEKESAVTDKVQSQPTKHSEQESDQKGTVSSNHSSELNLILLILSLFKILL